MQIAIEFQATQGDLQSHTSANQCNQCLARQDCLYQVLALFKLDKPANHYFHQVQLKKGQSLYHAGNPLTALYSLRSGYVKAEYSRPNGLYQINHFAVPGDLLGIDGIASGKHHLEAIALTDTKVCGIAYGTFAALMHQHPQILSAYERIIGKLLGHVENQLFCLGSLRVECKLAYFIVDFYERQQPWLLGLHMIRLPMGREDLCSHLGMTIETLSRAFNYLEKFGYLQVQNRNLMNIDYDRLKQLIDGEK